MATQVITRTLCDYCQHDDDVENPESERVLISIGNDEYELDGCAKHLKPLADLKASLDEVARKIPKRGRKPKGNNLPVTSDNADPNHGGNLCPECGQVLANRSSLASHVRQQHGKSLLELEGNSLSFVCPDCNKGFGNAAGLGAHKRVHAR